MFFVIDFIIFVCLINWVISYSPFILVDSFVDIPTDKPRALLFQSCTLLNDYDDGWD